MGATSRKIPIYVRLTNESVEVWRPVEAIHLDENRYQIIRDQSIPEDEKWEFAPGDIVEVTVRSFEGEARKMASRKIGR